MESPGDWLMPSNLDLSFEEITCSSSICEELSEADLLEQRRTLWMAVFNTGDRTMQSVAVDWLTVDTDPIELDGPFESVRLREAIDEVEADDTETLIDLAAGDGVLLPLGTVVRLSPLGGIRAIPIGEARIPLTLSYALTGDGDRQVIAVREPSETVISGGYDTTGAERIGLGG